MFAALYWNPNKVVFQIPFLDRPVVWYGVFFATGFLVGYYIALHLFKRYLLSRPFFTKSDIISYPRFLMTLRNKQNHPFLRGFLASLPVKFKEKIQTWNLGVQVDSKFEAAIIKHLNAFISSAPENVQAKLQHASLPFLNARLKASSNLLKRQISVRLMFENLFSDSIDDLNTRAKSLSEKLTIYTIIGTIIGARLGHIIFYEELLYFIQKPVEILKTWEGGLASHGGVIGIAIAYYIFTKKYAKRWQGITVLRLVDILAIPACFAAVMIRFGNFVNQEILGKPTAFFLGVFFANPMDGSLACVRHPAQLYEAASYLFSLFFLLFLVKKQNALAIKGKLTGYLFLLIFGFRFLIEYVKEDQSVYIFNSLNMGQLLSIPVFLIGGIILFLVRSKERSRADLSGVSS